jgi:hypothetical protein
VNSVYKVEGAIASRSIFSDSYGNNRLREVEILYFY